MPDRRYPIRPRPNPACTEKEPIQEPPQFLDGIFSCPNGTLRHGGLAPFVRSTRRAVRQKVPVPLPLQPAPNLRLPMHHNSPSMNHKGWARRPPPSTLDIGKTTTLLANRGLALLVRSIRRTGGKRCLSPSVLNHSEPRQSPPPNTSDIGKTAPLLTNSDQCRSAKTSVPFPSLSVIHASVKKPLDSWLTSFRAFSCFFVAKHKRLSAFISGFPSSVPPTKHPRYWQNHPLVDQLLPPKPCSLESDA